MSLLYTLPLTSGLLGEAAAHVPVLSSVGLERVCGMTGGERSRFRKEWKWHGMDGAATKHFKWQDGSEAQTGEPVQALHPKCSTGDAVGLSGGPVFHPAPPSPLLCLHKPFTRWFGEMKARQTGGLWLHAAGLSLSFTWDSFQQTTLVWTGQEPQSVCENRHLIIGPVSPWQG